VDDQTLEFPQEVLDFASKITFADLLDSPFSQPWAVSMLGNACGNRRSFSMSEDADVLLFAKLEQLLTKIPIEERKHLYKLCANMITARRERTNQAFRNYQTAESHSNAGS
jgi:hypothetical protein